MEFVVAFGIVMKNIIYIYLERCMLESWNTWLLYA